MQYSFRFWDYVYCYMTPYNIRIQENGLPVLFDVSVALPLGSPVSAIFDPHSFPMEVLLEECVAEPTIDIYSLGTNIYYALTGKSYNAAFLSKGCVSVENMEGVSDGVKFILKKCLQPYPKDRYQNFKELLSDLENIDKLQITKKKTAFFKKIFKIF